MTLKLVEVWVLITELHYVAQIEQKSKRMAIENRPERMSSPINNPAYFEILKFKWSEEPLFRIKNEFVI